jgi:glycosyltransferase involved in cell wall biosynthesis
VRNVEELHLFWFSQTVGKNRGLEDVVAALKEIDNPCIHLTLAGRCDNEMSKFLNQNSASLKKCIHLPGIIPPEELPGFAALYDVGLAAEINTPLNRNICLTNKIFTYLLAGNCILASNTDAQTRFMLEHDEVGLLYKNGDVSDLAEKIKFLYNDKTYLQKCKANALNLASNSMNWESESKKLLQVLENGS